MAMKSKVPETSRTERQDKAQEILKNRRVSEIKEWLMVSTLQPKPTPLWHVQISDTRCRAGCGVLLTELLSLGTKKGLEMCHDGFTVGLQLHCAHAFNAARVIRSEHLLPTRLPCVLLCATFPGFLLYGDAL